MFEPLQSVFDAVQTWLFESAVQPVVYAMGWMVVQEEAYAATEWFLLGLIQVALLYAVLRPLEARFPAETWTDRRGTGVDVIYTLLHRLGLLPLALFLVFTPLFENITQVLRDAGYTPLAIDALVPGVTDVPIVSFLIYLVVLDFVDYWLHRGQHRFRWWWALHALHHSQQKMSFWTDDRNHLLDDVIIDGAKALIALFIGVEPAQFVGLIIATRVMHRPGARVGRAGVPGRPQLRRAVPGVGPPLRHRPPRRPLRAHRHPGPAPGRGRARLRQRLLGAAVVGAQTPGGPGLSVGRPSALGALGQHSLVRLSTPRTLQHPPLPPLGTRRHLLRMIRRP